jgi:hypothetical protein
MAAVPCFQSALLRMHDADIKSGSIIRQQQKLIRAHCVARKQQQCQLVSREFCDLYFL